MNALGIPTTGLAPLGLLAARVIVGVIMFAHGLQKLTGMGPSGFAQNALANLGVPAPELMAYVVIFAELIGGLLLIVGLLSRLAALVLTINLAVAIILVKVSIGFLSPMGSPGVGAELDLALIAGFLAILLVGPGRLSLDYALGLERVPAAGRNGERAERA